MPRVIIKGGIWKNTEDEILKAAVGKYGLNQWARISSLLVRKTPKQCKARWYEWLDPGIKKTEWSKEEEEKLLHLAKLMPTQWRTIAPLVGRTPAQCLEHYERLLDRAQGREDDDHAADDPRRLRAGEMDPNPETKPAKPDPVDMDEDEKEMLAEARARLANTQGKKAKRKAREKQLEEARRLAAMQKRRELKAAGIDYRPHKKRRGIDYNAEIPFYKPVPAGFYNTSEEDQASSSTFKGAWLADLEGERRDAKAEEARKRDTAKQKERAKQGLPPVPSQLAKLSEELPFARSKLSLPAPQVGDAELDEIVKLGTAGERAKAMVTDDSANPASDRLLANYAVSTPAMHGQMRTPRVGGVDTVMLEARNQAALQQLNTPLQGGQTPVLHQLPPPTPTSAVSAGATPLRTPARDQLRINEDGVLPIEATPRPQQQQIRQQLRSQLSALPKPKNEFEVVLPEDEEDQEEDASKDGSSMPEDAADIAARKRAEAERAEQIRLSLRPQAIQRGLPRPTVVNAGMAAPTTDEELADQLIKAEMLAMLNHDAVAHPVRGAAVRPGAPPPPLDEFTQTELGEAKALLLEEMLEIGKSIPAEQFDRLHAAVQADFAYLPSQRRFVRLSAVPKSERVQALANELEMHRANMAKETKRASKVASKLDVILGGYQTRAAVLQKQITDITKELAQSTLEYESFAGLAAIERSAIESRIQYLQGAVTAQFDREKELQQRYADLQHERAVLVGHVAAL